MPMSPPDAREVAGVVVFPPYICGREPEREFQEWHTKRKIRTSATVIVNRCIHGMTSVCVLQSVNIEYTCF